MMAKKLANRLGMLIFLVLVIFQGVNRPAIAENCGITGDSSADNATAANSQNGKSSASWQHPSGLSLNFQYDFGKATYGDSDGNGFDNATILGGGLGAVMDFRGPWSLWTNFNDSNSYDALTVYPGYEILDPSIKSDEKGTLTNRIMDGGISYRLNPGRIFDQFQVGIGWLDYDFVAEEHGYLETRDYSGVEALFHAEKKLNDRLIVQGYLQLAPTMTVADKVKGAYNDPDRTANTSYGAYFWSTKWGVRIMVSPRMWLESGFTYQALHGDGHEHPDYRFLEHDYNRSGFYVLFGTRLFGAANSPGARPQNTNPVAPAGVAVEVKPQEPAAVQHPTLTVTKISPNEGFVNTQVDLTIDGTGFLPGAQVALHAGETVAPVTKVVLISENQLSCSLDLKNAVPGTYALKVVDVDGQLCEIPKAFTVKQPALPAAVTASSGEGFNNGSILITFKGANFVPGTSVKMISPSGKVVSGEIVKVQPNEITGFFNLKNQGEGSYDVLVTYPDGHSVKLAADFQVKAFSEGNSRRLMPVYFDVDQAIIGADQIESIKNRLPELLKNPKAKIILGGYTDMRGSVGYNLALSMRRVEAVKEILTAGGVNPNQIAIYAYGKEKAGQGRDEKVWRNDRRVDIVIYQEK